MLIQLHVDASSVKFPRQQENSRQTRTIPNTVFGMASKKGSIFHWVESTSKTALPKNAVAGGHEKDKKHTLFVGRCHHINSVIPAKINSSSKEATYSWDGTEFKVQNYEVLCEQKYEWIAASDGKVPPNAIPSGRTKDGELMYVGRGQHEGDTIVGKIHPSHGCMFIPFYGKEYRATKYEALVLQ